MINDLYFESFPHRETERLIFRKLDLKDAADIQLIRSDDKVMNYMGSEKHKTVDDSKDFILKNLDRYQNKTGIFWAIIEKSGNQFIGDFAFR